MVDADPWEGRPSCVRHRLPSRKRVSETTRTRCASSIAVYGKSTYEADCSQASGGRSRSPMRCVPRLLRRLHGPYALKLGAAGVGPFEEADGRASLAQWLDATRSLVVGRILQGIGQLLNLESSFNPALA